MSHLKIEAYSSPYQSTSPLNRLHVAWDIGRLPECDRLSRNERNPLFIHT